MKSGRNEWIKQLMDVIPVHSFGRCYNNKQKEARGCTQDHYEGKICTIRQYKFYLAFENSIDESYVTEKYYQGNCNKLLLFISSALYAGTVPVYLGAPNIHEFDPLYEPLPNGDPNPDWKPRSLIRVSDFKNAQELASFLKELSEDEARYNTYLEWKTKPINARFARLINMTLDHDITGCRICQYVAEERERKRKNKQ